MSTAQSMVANWSCIETEHGKVSAYFCWES